jgi:hypothetical protein
VELLPAVSRVIYFFLIGGFARGAVRPQGNGTERRLGKGKSTRLFGTADSHVVLLAKRNIKHIRFTQFRTYSFRFSRHN